MKFHLRKFSFFIALVSFFLLQSCNNEPPTDLAKESIIPKPVSVVATGNGFTLTNLSGIFVEGGSEELLAIGNDLSAQINKITGFSPKVEATNGEPKAGNIYLLVDGADPKLGSEGYTLTITEDLLTIKANRPSGVYMGMQTVSLKPKKKS